MSFTLWSGSVAPELLSSDRKFLYQSSCVSVFKIKDLTAPGSYQRELQVWSHGVRPVRKARIWPGLGQRRSARLMLRWSFRSSSPNHQHLLLIAHCPGQQHHRLQEAIKTIASSFLGGQSATRQRSSEVPAPTLPSQSCPRREARPDAFSRVWGGGSRRCTPGAPPPFVGLSLHKFGR